MDGFEVCRRLKGDQKIAHIPVIMITALTGRDDLTHLIVHDVKNNLLGLSLVLGMLQGLQELIASMLDATRPCCAASS